MEYSWFQIIFIFLQIAIVPIACKWLTPPLTGPSIAEMASKGLNPTGIIEREWDAETDILQIRIGN
jgi:hypothetical protein